MKDIGIPELKAHASELVRHVAEEHATYTITRRGRPVGVLAPPDFVQPQRAETDDAAWQRLRELWRRADQAGKPGKIEPAILPVEIAAALAHAGEKPAWAADYAESMLNEANE